MTTGLDRKAHRLVELARSGDEPTAAQLLSLHGAIAARIAAEGAIAASGTTASVKAASAGAFVKGLVVAGAIATGAAGFFALRSPSSSPPPAVVVARPPVVAPRPVVAPPPLVEAPPAPAVVAPSAAPASKAPKLPGPPRLQDEAALLAEVQGALRKGQGGLAQSLLESYDRRFPTGMLRSEADAARVFALCSAGRVDKARAFAERFVQRYPSSPAAARVQAACK
jgi:hypothetical protein